MMMSGGPRLILASASAARRDLLAASGLDFTVMVASVDETAIKRSMQAAGNGASETALALAGAKARRVREPGCLVIGADQILECEGTWFDKPPDLPSARAHLMRLQGRTHELHTAVTCWRDGHPVWHHVARPRLCMRPVSDGFLDAYLAMEGEAVLASVGAYRVEGRGMQLFDAMEGEHAAILGLPMLPLLGFLRQQGVILG